MTKLIIHIPARKGSKRVKKKNARIMNGKPMISYAIKTAVEAKLNCEIYVDTDDEDLIKYVNLNFPGVKIHERDPKLASDSAQSDDFVYDFIVKKKPDILMTLFPTCPLIQSKTIKNAYAQFQLSEVDTLISCNETKMQTFHGNDPVNINVNEKLKPSQDNKPIRTLNWGITIWDASKFKIRFETQGFASLGEERCLFKIPIEESFKVSNEEDFILCENLLKIKSS